MSEDSYYFSSYSTIYIHEEMLKDKIRTNIYRLALEKNRSNVKDKIVLDVGTGTGILLLFAANFGAAHVYGVDKSDIIDLTKKIVEDNKFTDKTTLIKASVEEAQLDTKVDLIISEWMGYALLFESMLPSVLNARNRFLREGGTLFPNFARMHIACFSDELTWKSHIEKWDNIYGFNFLPIKEWALSEVHVDRIYGDNVMTNSCQLIEFDLNKIEESDLSILCKFQLMPIEPRVIHGFVLWFEVIFRGDDETVVLSTSPFDPPTHWSQSIFFLRNPIPVVMESVIEGIYVQKPHPTFVRDQEMMIQFTVDNQLYKQNFTLR